MKPRLGESPGRGQTRKQLDICVDDDTEVTKSSRVGQKLGWQVLFGNNLIHNLSFLTAGRMTPPAIPIPERLWAQENNSRSCQVEKQPSFSRSQREVILTLPGAGFRNLEVSTSQLAIQVPRRLPPYIS